MQDTTQETQAAKLRRTQKIVRRSLLVLFSSVGLWIYGLTLYVDSLPKTLNSDQSATDGIVIFTGGTMRLEEGIKLLSDNKGQRLLVSGVGERAGLDSVLMLSGGALPDNIIELKDRIDLGYTAKNTRGNAIEVEKWVREHNYKTIRLVTANYHMPRSYFELNREMPDVTIIKNPVFPNEVKLQKWWQHGLTKRLLVSEYNKYIARRVSALFGM
jgi:uncharacterized SAM-binding protein YcdF (DUF218 family)